MTRSFPFAETLDEIGARLRTLFGADAPMVPVVRLEGMIAAGGRGSTLNLARVERLLDKAFGMARAEAVAIVVNSPGGSPVQSRLIHERIRLLAKAKGKRVLVFCEDVAASGGYMIACAGDEVFADPGSILGSIGVISASFGFTDAMEKLGVERRLRTAGKSKSLGDPFSPETPEQSERMERLLEAIHTQFIALVRTARGDRLDPEAELFDGSIFTGEEAVAVGLADGLAELRAELQRRYGERVRLRPMSPPRGGLLARLSGAAVEAVETRAAWARFGL